MKTSLMLYPTNAEANMAFERVLLAGSGIKNFNKHEGWLMSGIAKIYFMGATFPEKLLKMKFDGVWVDERVNTDKPFAHFRSIEDMLVSRMTDDANPFQYLKRGSSQLIEASV